MIKTYAIMSQCIEFAQLVVFLIFVGAIIVEAVVYVDIRVKLKIISDFTLSIINSFYL